MKFFAHAFPCIVLSACAVAPCGESHPAYPFAVSGIIREFRPEAVTIDFANGEAKPNGARLLVTAPKQMEGQSIWLYYNGSPTLNNHAVHLGDKISFIVRKEGDLSLPFLAQLPSGTVTP